ncbi:MAG: hypothetical protein A2X25_10555 [Chloroflexi bacterium GWB2_49_20]|nr:MAG: hypothetical protein A2X25_10555 [Chloroflexi bacterium GWB2_49_20]OGN78997.1 MAG: hypothetical protein A2X26_00800 [Chloroflexi bacterium GWC2_49_37]OGN86242.1 MAG: hypothetical protein A2X27_04980 [Chloroflexi bacterium GWD2_49_16]
MSRLEILVFALTISVLFSGSTLIVADQTERVRVYTRVVEFDYFEWTVNAIGVKLVQATLHTPNYYDEYNQHQIVLDYLKLTDEIIQQEYQLKIIFSDPNIQNPDSVSKAQQAHLNQLYESQRKLASTAEAVLEQQISEILREQGLTEIVLPIPPVLFHITPLPYNLIISPRNNIQQEESISLVPDLPVNIQVDLENKIDKALNVSSLVVPVGGIGSYPTMIERSTSLNWLSSTIAHEWIHNWLELRPLGKSYEITNELRTMNETTASIAGDEIGRLFIQKFYPELLTKENGNISVNFPSSRPDPNDLPRLQFDFRAEMHKTRISVDDQLAKGKVDEAESYMESRRQVFWDNGYAIRKLNQAYFAFYGAYADLPGGAAGEDPVGPAVRALRAQSPTLVVFLKKISQMTTFDELKAAVSK